MSRQAAGPEAEAVVVLGGEDQRARTCRAGRARPLARVEARGIEDRGILGAVAPLAVGERVHPEVQEERELVALPAQLRRRRQRADGNLALARGKESGAKRTCGTEKLAA
jgi:hypothetical protein